MVQYLFAIIIYYGFHNDYKDDGNKIKKIYIIFFKKIKVRLVPATIYLVVFPCFLIVHLRWMEGRREFIMFWKQNINPENIK